jgi:hypothetical protein
MAEDRASPRERRHGGCPAAQVVAGAAFLSLSAWIWLVVDCVPGELGEGKLVECDPLPAATRVVMNVVAIPLALVIGAAIGGIVTRLRLR